jgi:PLP dependent protein
MLMGCVFSSPGGAKKRKKGGQVKLVDIQRDYRYIQALFSMIPANIDTIRRRMAAACAKAGRPLADVTLVAVTKTFPSPLIREAAAAGVADIGENYVQELLGKREELAGLPLRWHFIGHLQRNKVRQIAPWVEMIHAVDDRALAAEIDRRAAQHGRVIDILVEVNTTGERTKFGLAPEAALSFIRSLEGLTHIRIAGLMTIGPFLPDPEGSRPMFRRLRELREEAMGLAQENATLRHLSMGMTGDFEVAIDEGATHIRIGTAIFGSRVKRP